MIIYGEKTLPYQVTVFTDIDCGYCRKLHSQIKEYNEEGIRIRYLAYPRSGIMRDGKMTDSAALAESVWCADDRHAALTDAKAGKDVPNKKCGSPVSAQYQLGQDFGVTGTPALLFNDGELVPGYVPPKRLAAALKAQQKK
jgi:thiol:disulfide interchange protein DsbC